MDIRSRHALDMLEYQPDAKGFDQYEKISQSQTDGIMPVGTARAANNSRRRNKAQNRTTAKDVNGMHRRRIKKML